MTDLKGRKIEAMHRLFGVHMGKQCSECPHLLSYNYRARHYYKCKIYGLSNSEATDWRLKYQACCMIDKEADPKALPVVEVIRYQNVGRLKKVPLSCEGQISMETGEL